MNQHTSNSNSNRGDQSQLDAAISAVVSEPILSDAVDRIKGRAMVLATDSPESRVQLTSDKRSSSLRWLQMAILAASVLIVVGVVVPLGSPPASAASAAFVEMIQQLKETGAYSYTTEVYMETLKNPMVSKEMVSEEGRRRSEGSGMITLSDQNGCPRLLLDKQLRIAMVNKEEDWPAAGGIEWGEIINKLKSQTKPDGSLGIKQIDGRDFEGFSTLPEGSRVSVWIAVDKPDLVQIEALVEHSSVTKVVMKDFQFNQTFDESLFSFEVPKGYSVDTLPEIDLANIPTVEESMVGALRAFTKLSDGKFPKKPANLDGWAEWMSPNNDSDMSLLESIGQAFVEEWAITEEDREVRQEQELELTNHVIFVCSFVAQMSQNDYDYLGDGITTDDERTIVFWYRAEENHFRAIYSDFSVSDIDEADLPKE